jgi:CBS domain-containing protein
VAHWKDVAGAPVADLMTRRVHVVAHDAEVRAAAKLLLDAEVGAAPVLDADGTPIGMVSDGDLLGRRSDRKAWWLHLLATSALPANWPADAGERPVSAVMTTPLISVGPGATTREVVQRLQAHRIKRLPVLEDGRLVGLVSRTDVLRLFDHPPLGGEPAGGLEKFLQALFAAPAHLSPAARLAASLPEAGVHDAVVPQLTASDLQALAMGFQDRKAAEIAEAERAAGLERERQVKAMLESHVDDAFWRSLLDHARQAAGNGEKELLLLRFPCGLCSDHGRAINVAEDDWPSTLRGEAAEIRDRWEAELKLKGFHLNARVISFDHGMPGDCGLFLSWGGMDS